MAIEKSIRGAPVSSAPIDAQTPEPPPPLQSCRLLTVCPGMKCGTRIRIEGNWLEDAGFKAGMRVKIIVDEGRLVVEAEPVPESTVENKRRKRRSWVHDYPNTPGFIGFERRNGERPGESMVQATVDPSTHREDSAPLGPGCAIQKPAEDGDLNARAAGSSPEL